MKAIVQDVYGSVDVLELRDVDTPVPGDDDVLIRVRAAGVDQGVWHLMTRAAVPDPRRRLRAEDAEDRVSAGGSCRRGGGGRPERRRISARRRGVRHCEGSFAEYVCAKEGRLALEAEEPQLRAGRRRARSPPARRSRGSATAGGSRPDRRSSLSARLAASARYAVQLAKAFGAQVTGVCSTAKTELVRSIGADHVIDYTHDDFADGAKQWDLILDTAGNRTLSVLRRALKPHGTLVIVGGEGGGQADGRL